MVNVFTIVTSNSFGISPTLINKRQGNRRGNKEWRIQRHRKHWVHKT